MDEDNGLADHYSRRSGDHHYSGYPNGTAHVGTVRESDLLSDDGAVHISHRISGINFTPTLHDSLVNEIRKLRNKLDKRENEVRQLNEELDLLRESHDNLQETHDALASNSSKDIRSLRAQLERNAALHVSEVKSLRSDLQDTTSAVQDLKSRLENSRRAKSAAEEQRDKYRSELDELRIQSNGMKTDLERRLGRETEKIKVLEDLVRKMEAEIERSTMGVKSSGSGSERSSLDIPREKIQDEDDEDEEEVISPRAKHQSIGSPVKTLFAEMASMEEGDEESDEEDEAAEDDTAGQFSSPQSPVSSVSAPSTVPSVAVAQVLQTLRESVLIETVDQAVQTEEIHAVPLIRVLSPTPPLTNAPLILSEDHDVEKVNQFTQTEIRTSSQSTQTEPALVVSPLFKLSPPPTSAKSPILRPQNSIRRGSHTVRWQEDKSIQTETQPASSAEIAIQTDPFVLAKILKPALKTPTSEAKEAEKEKLVKHGQVKSYDGPTRSAGTAKVGSTRRLESHRSSVIFTNPAGAQLNGHERRSSGSSGSHSRKVSNSQSQTDLRRGRAPHPGWMKTRSHANAARGPPAMQLHTPTGMLKSANVNPPLPIPQRSSSKFRVVLPIVRDKPMPEEQLSEVAEEVDEVQDSADEEERTRREVNEFLARAPRKTVRQIRSAINLRPGSSQDGVPPTPDRYNHSPASFTPSTAELAPKSYSTPRRPPKRLVKLRPPPQDTPLSSISPASSYFPTSEEISVVDEIARCMVGEYMYKYVRRRRRGSFTWRRSPARPNGNAEEVEESTIRHKRWVWLQPYEKMILWSSTQPSQSNFLQRAQVKKRVVTGVLDVRDDTPLMSSPSGQVVSSPIHTRSIVVLTPTQAIKFTTLSRERHVSWLTALNFLVHNDPTDLIIPRGITSSPSHGSLWGSHYPPSGTASSITSSQGTAQFLGNLAQAQFGSYTVRKNSLPDFVDRHASREDQSPLGHRTRYDDESYATPPSVPRIPTGRRFEGGRERSGSGSGSREWDDPSWGNRETIRMDAFVRRSPPRLEVDIDHSLFREF